MKKQTVNILFCAAVAAVAVLAVAIDRRSASRSEADMSSQQKVEKRHGGTKNASKTKVRKEGLARPSRRVSLETIAAERPHVEPNMDERAFSKWLDPRPPRTGDEMENIPEDEEEFPIRQLDAQARFRSAVFATLADKTLNHPQFGRSLMTSQTPSLRSLGAALLVETGTFSRADASALASDSDVSVPLSILEWIRERGTPEQLSELEAAFAERGVSVEELLASIESLSSATGGAREALDMLIKIAPEDDLPDILTAIANCESAAYDARMQALMALRGVAPFSVADGVMVGMELAAEPPEESLWGESLDLYSDLVDLAASDKAPYKVWDVLVRDIEFLATLDYENAVRDMANYVENGVRGDDPVVQEGAWRLIDEYISQVKSSDKASTAAVAEPLARLERLNNRLKPFDPEFVEPDPDPIPGLPESVSEEDESPAASEEAEDPEPDSDDEDAGSMQTDSFGNPAGSGSSEVPIGVETVAPYQP